MPVVSIQALELDAKQKKQIAREYTRILSHVTNVPRENIYVFFGGFPLNAISAGGVLNSALPDSVLSHFNIKYTKHREKPGTICVMTRMKAKPGMEEEAERASLEFVKETRKEPGCISYDLFRSKKDIYKKERTSSWFILQERFRDMASVGEHMETAHFKAYMARMDKLFDGGFEVCSKISGPSRNTAEVTEGKIKLVVWMHAQEKKIDPILKGNLEMRKQMKKLDGSLAYDLYQGFPGIYDQSVFLADQIWKDQKSLDHAIESILVDMPFFMEDLRTTRQALVFEMASELPYELPKEEPFLFENAVAGDHDLKEGLAKMNPEFAKLCIDASKKAYDTPLLDQRSKILFALVVDVVEQIHGKPFENHLLMAKKNGISKEELFEMLLFLTVYVGFNKAGAYYQPINAFYG